MAPRSERVNVGTLAALGTSIGLHACLAVLLVARLPLTSDAGPDFAVSVSIGAPEVETAGAVPVSSVAAVLPVAIEHPVAALAPAAAPMANVAASESAVASPSLAPALQESAPSSLAVTPSSSPAVPALEARVLRPDEPVTPTAVLVSRPPPAPLAAVAPPIGTPHSPVPVAIASVGSDAAEPPTTQNTVATSAAIVAATAASVVPAAQPPASSARLQGSDVGLSDLPMKVAVPAPIGTLVDVTGVATAVVSPRDDVIAAVAPPDPRTNIAPSVSSRPQRVVQAAHLPAGALMVHEETEAERVRMVQSFIDRYDGGPCFLMAPAAHVTSDFDIEGFATDRDKVHRFDDGFKQETGREARVVGQWISQKQCVAVDFVQAAKHAAKGLTIEIERRDLSKGGVLTGTVDGAGSEPIRLFWVSESGVVDDISERVQDRGERKTFAVPVRRSIVGGPYPQLLVAIVGDDWPVPAGETLKADAFFASIQANALKAHRSISAGGRPFRLVP